MATGWSATSDNALIAIRALDVLGLEHHPLVGTWSSFSESAGSIVHHPGPLLFDVLALPSRLLGTDVGIPLAVGTLNAVCAAWTVSIIGRCGGLAARLVAGVVTGLLAWTMSWPFLIDPWNPHAAMLPALLFFVACGALTLGEPAAALPAVVAGSLCLQIHLGYTYIMGLTVLATIGLRLLQRRSVVAAPWSTRQRVVPIVVLAALWVQPLIDLIANRGDSNVAAMLGNLDSPSGQIGLSLAVRLSAAVVAVPPWWLPNGFEGPTAFDPPPSLGVAAVALAVVVAALLAVAWRGPTGDVRAFGRYVAVLVPLAVLSVSRVPLNDFVGYARHQWRWLWVLGALVALVVGWAGAGFFRRSSAATAVAVATSVCVIGLSALGDTRALPLADQERDAIGELVDALPYDELRRCAPVTVDFPLGFDPPGLVGPSVLLALRQRGVPFAPTAADSIAQLERRPPTRDTCRLTLAEQPAVGRVVGAIEDGPLAVVVTLAVAE